MARFTIASVTLFASHVALADAAPEDKARARTLMDEGDRFVLAKSYAEALDAYERADAIMHVPTTTIEVARTNAALGHYVAAHEAAATLAGKYADKIGSLVITLAPADATAIVTVDHLVRRLLRESRRTLQSERVRVPRRAGRGHVEPTFDVVRDQPRLRNVDVHGADPRRRARIRSLLLRLSAPTGTRRHATKPA